VSEQARPAQPVATSGTGSESMGDADAASWNAARARREALLAERLVSLADTLVDDFDVVELLSRLVDSCVELLGVSAAGLLLVDRGGALRPMAFTNQDAMFLELFQVQNDEGPCLDAVRSGTAVSATDLTQALTRWPRFAAAALKHGFASVQALPMRLRGTCIGGLNLFTGEQPPLGEADQKVAQALADVATIGILQQRSREHAALVSEQLQEALDSRIVIEQAKGLLAGRGNVDPDQAFHALRGFARTTNQRLTAVAASLVQRQLDTDTVLDRLRRSP
jgi:GAF domain-containing protein